MQEGGAAIRDLRQFLPVETGVAADVQLCTEVAQSHSDNGLPAGQRVGVFFVTYVKLFVGFLPREDVYSDQ